MTDSTFHFTALVLATSTVLVSAEPLAPRRLGLFDAFPSALKIPDFTEISEFATASVCSTFPRMCDEPVQGFGPACPDVSPLDDSSFNLTQFVDHSWYVQMQQEYPLLTQDQFFCVVNTYNMRDNGFIQVKSYANNEAVGGNVVSLDQYGPLTGTCLKHEGGGDFEFGNCVSSELPSLKVGESETSFLSETFGLDKIDMGIFDLTSGPYWIIAADTKNYSWAVVSGGPPDQETDEEDEEGLPLCTTRSGETILDINLGTGLWLMTKDSMPSEEVMDEMKTTLTNMRISMIDLKVVQQDGCQYNEAELKGSVVEPQK